MTKTETQFSVETLWVDTVGVRSVEADWDQLGGEFREDFKSYEAPECPDCSEYAAWSGIEWECQNKECENYQGEVENDSEGPMMNYYYPLPDLRRVGDSPNEAAARIADLPLCIVELAGSYALALTGGGMDLSWEICEAFTRLGYLPPLAFCDLPKLAGKEIGEGARYVISACLRSADVAASQAARAKARLIEAYPEA